MIRRGVNGTPRSDAEPPSSNAGLSVIGATVRARPVVEEPAEAGVDRFPPALLPRVRERAKGTSDIPALRTPCS